MAKRAIIIHGWGGSPQDCWIPWLKAKLKKKGFIVSVPKMPSEKDTTEQAWVDKITKTVKEYDDECYFIGHSLGCISVLRYIERWNSRFKVGGCILVAGFIESIDIPELEEFTNHPLDTEKIRETCKKIVVIGSDDDEEISLSKTEKMVHELKAQFILEPGKGHFDDYANVKELPSALKAILEMSK